MRRRRIYTAHYVNNSSFVLQGIKLGFFFLFVCLFSPVKAQLESGIALICCSCALPQVRHKLRILLFLFSKSISVRMKCRWKTGTLWASDCIYTGPAVEYRTRLHVNHRQTTLYYIRCWPAADGGAALQLLTAVPVRMYRERTCLLLFQLRALLGWQTAALHPGKE